MKFAKLLIFSAGIMGICACSNTWNQEEKQIISSADERGVMRVLTVEEPSDLAVLRKKCKDLTQEDLKSEYYQDLTRQMLATVSSPEQDGVGIAGPQVGISRRVVAVMRLDKYGEPFEVYPNIRIIATRGEKEKGNEGCLSVPGRKGAVCRWRDIDIRYSRLNAKGTELKDTVEHITGFTAVIFQHECDHLDGVIYTDKLDSEE